MIASVFFVANILLAVVVARNIPGRRIFVKCVVELVQVVDLEGLVIPILD